MLAVDAEPTAIAALTARADLSARDRARLETRVRAYDDPALALPAADLVNASFTLPGLAPDAFGRLWRRIGAALRPGGRFAGHLYGPRDSWAAKHPSMTFHARPQVEALLGGYKIEMLEEEETDSTTPRGEPKHWHIFHIVALKPAAKLA